MTGLRNERALWTRAVGNVLPGRNRARLSLNERGLSVPLMLFDSYSWWNSLTAAQHEAHNSCGPSKPLGRLTRVILPQCVKGAASQPLYISDL